MSGKAVYQSPDIEVDSVEEKKKTKTKGDKTYFEKVVLTDVESGDITITLRMNKLPDEFKKEHPPKMRIKFTLVNQTLDA